MIFGKSVWFSPYFSTLSHKCHDLRKKASGFHHIFPHYLTNAMIFGKKRLVFTIFFHIISQMPWSSEKSVWFPPYFSTLSHKCHDLRKKVSGFHHIFPHYLTNAMIFGKKCLVFTIFFHIISQMPWSSEKMSGFHHIFPHYLTNAMIFGKSVWFSPYFSTLSHKCHDLRKKVSGFHHIFPHHLTNVTIFGKKCLVFTIFFHIISQIPWSSEKSVWFSPYFSTLSHKFHDLRKKVSGFHHIFPHYLTNAMIFGKKCLVSTIFFHIISQMPWSSGKKNTELKMRCFSRSYSCTNVTILLKNPTNAQIHVNTALFTLFTATCFSLKGPSSESMIHISWEGSPK